MTAAPVLPRSPGVTLAFLRRVVPIGGASLALFLSILVALFEAVGVFLLIPLLGLVGVEMGPGTSGGIASFVEAGLGSLGIPVTLVSVLSVYVAVVAGQAAIGYTEALNALRLRETVAARMRHLLYRAMTRLSWRGFLARHSSHYVHALTTQLERAHLALSQALSLVAQTAIAIAYIALAIWISPALSLLALVGGLGLVLAGRTHSRALQARGDELNDATRRLHRVVVEHLSNMKVAKSIGAEAQHLRHFEQASADVLRTWSATGAAFGGARRLFTIGAAVLLAFVVYTAVARFAFDPASVLVLLYVFARLLPRIGALQQLGNQTLHALPALRATAAELAAYEAVGSPDVHDGHPPPVINTAVELRDVSFGYADNAPLLRDVNLLARAGEITVITGASGSGKTTIADLILGLLEPGSGELRVDGVPIARQELDGWRRCTAYVSQESVLYDDSVRGNLMWAAPGASETEIRRALTDAQAEFVYSLPQGLDTLVGERGAWLSGGERQRLAIARALLRKPQLLVLDEPTSSLDSDNERRVLDVLRSLRGSLTIVLISHRQAAISVADRVFIVQEGGVTPASREDSLQLLAGH